MPITSSKDAKAVEMIRSIVMNDNTFEKDLGDIIEIMTNPVIVEIQQAAYDMRKRKQKAVEEERAFQSEQSDKLIASEDKRLKDERDNEIELERMGNETAIEVAQLSAYGRLGDKQVTDMAMYDRVDALAQNSIQNTFKAEELKLKQTSATSKIAEDRENRKIKLAELIGKSEDRRLKERALDITREGNIINKN
jgi:hypothetical protein